MLKHPKELDFELGLTIYIDEPARITAKLGASRKSDVVYVALLKDGSRPLEKGDALKVGQTGQTLLKRWTGTVGIFNRDVSKLKNDSVRNDRRKWLEAAKGKEVSVWVKEPGEIEISYAKGLITSRVTSRWVEEAILDHYYQPKVREQQDKEAPNHIGDFN